MAVVLFVRIRTALGPDVLAQKASERRTEYAAVPGLIQKIYGRDPGSGDACGIYFFESREHLLAFRDSPLAGSIAAAYEAIDVRPEVYEVLDSLRPEAGPLPRA